MRASIRLALDAVVAGAAHEIVRAWGSGAAALRGALAAVGGIKFGIRVAPGWHLRFETPRRELALETLPNGRLLLPVLDLVALVVLDCLPQAGMEARAVERQCAGGG